jgi:O-antigen ligase
MSTATVDRRIDRRLLLTAPVFGFALLGPYLPLLILFAGTLPAAAPHPPRELAAGIALATAIALLAGIVGLVQSGVRVFPKSLWLPLAAVLLAQVVATGFAVVPDAGVFSIATMLAGFVVLICAAEVLGDDRVRRAFIGCYLISAAVAAVGACVLSVSRLPPAMYAYEHGRASGTFLQPNELAGYLLFVIPIGLAQIAAPRQLRTIGLIVAACGALGLLLSVSRAAIISLLVALFFFVRKLGRRETTGYLIAASVGLLLFVTVFRDVAHDPSENASRLAVWAGAARIAERFALTGVGPFGFHLVYPAFRLPEYSASEVHAHSLPLQLLIENGILGLSAVCWFVIAAARASAREGRRIAQHDAERVLLFAALVTGFVATALQNIVDVVSTFLLVVAWPMLGMLLALGSSEEIAA